MTSRVFRSIVAILSVLLVAGTPAHGGPVTIAKVVQVLDTYRDPPKLRLRVASQSSWRVSGVRGSTQGPSGMKHLGGKESASSPNAYGAGPATNDSTDSLLSGIAVSSDDPRATVSVIDQGDLEGTICDCGGDLTVSGGGLPKWPLLFLAAIPLFFIHGCHQCETLTSAPTLALPQTLTTTIAQIPEPASLLVLGSGLAAFAGLRRRRASAKRAAEIASGLRANRRTGGQNDDISL